MKSFKIISLLCVVFILMGASGLFAYTDEITTGIKITITAGEVVSIRNAFCAEGTCPPCTNVEADLLASQMKVVNGERVCIQNNGNVACDLGLQITETNGFTLIDTGDWNTVGALADGEIHVSAIFVGDGDWTDTYAPDDFTTLDYVKNDNVIWASATAYAKDLMSDGSKGFDVPVAADDDDPLAMRNIIIGVKTGAFTVDTSDSVVLLIKATKHLP